MTLPSQAKSEPGLFDRFADAANRFVSRAWFFVLCIALIVIWAPSLLLVKNFDTWQLLINTPTTIITFLLVALLQNTAKRGDDSTQQKLNGIAMYLLGDGGDDDRQELRDAVGLEEKEST